MRLPSVENYDTVDHLISDCPRFETESAQKITQIQNIELRMSLPRERTQGKWEAVKKIYTWECWWEITQ
jgi:hypothetical protein